MALWPSRDNELREVAAETEAPRLSYANARWDQRGTRFASLFPASGTCFLASR